MAEDSVPLRPDAMLDPEYRRLLAESIRLRRIGAPRKEWSIPSLQAARLKGGMMRKWRQSLPQEDRVETHVRHNQGGKDPLDTGTVDRTIYLVSEWSPKGVQLLMRMAEGEKCSCCKGCKATRPDLRAITALTGLLQDAIKLRIAQMESRLRKKDKAEVYDIGWAAEGDKG